MTDQIGLLGAFLGGLLTLVSPCAALLLPSFFAFTYTGFGSLITRVGLFFLGLIAVLVPVGAGVGAAGSLFIDHRRLLVTIGAIVIIVLGVVMILGRGFGLGKLSGLANGVDVTGPLSTIALGAVYGFAGFCSGPILGAVLTVGLVSGSPGYGALVMTAYAVGMTLPLLLLAALWPRIGERVRSVLRGREVTWGRFTVHTTSLISTGPDRDRHLRVGHRGHRLRRFTRRQRHPVRLAVDDRRVDVRDLRPGSGDRPGRRGLRGGGGPCLPTESLGRVMLVRFAHLSLSTLIQLAFAHQAR